MKFKTPAFWFKQTSILAYALLPFSYIYTYLAFCVRCIQKQRSQKLDMPTICVGNLVMGGAGKTPTVLALADLLKSQGNKLLIASRGYGGTQVYTGLVQPLTSYQEAGDEPVLMAQYHPVWVGHDRSKVKDIFQDPPQKTWILFDDGLQNQTLDYDMRIVVIDALQGIGNGFIFPSGPLRPGWKHILEQADRIIFIKHMEESYPKYLDPYKNKIIEARLQVYDQPNLKRVIGFAGIGYPLKFKKTLIACNYDVLRFLPFPDHYDYQQEDIEKLINLSRKLHASLITTEKDFVRLKNLNIHHSIHVLKIQLSLPSGSIMF